MTESTHTSPARWHLKLGIAPVLAGVAVLVPRFREILIALANKLFDLGLTIDQPKWVGVFLVVVGLVVIAAGELLRREAHPKPLYIVFRHHSLESVSVRLKPDDLPHNFRSYAIRETDCDQSRYFANGSFDPVGAVRLQQEKIAEFSGARKTLGDVPLGYYGLAHIPLQFLAGCAFSTHAPVQLFDLNRVSNRWNSLSERGASPFVVNVHTFERPYHASAVAIRVSISYEVDIADVRAILSDPFEDIRIGLPTPRIDAIASYDQVKEICTRFRGVLDEIHARVDKSKDVHVFYAGPAVLGFSLGRQITKTIHHRVLVHNYTSATQPRYSWAVDVTSDGNPEVMVFAAG